ncbi:MAG: redox-sensing transcriptional repressor Rex [Spirochaetota bacterium]
MSTLDAALAYLSDHRDDFLERWKELVSIPSISTDPDHNADVARAAEWLRARLEEYGAAETRIVATDGHPLVWAEFPAASDDAPSVLVYGHYDVQPVDPIELWESDPFEPTIRDGRLYARGASDMKAQVMATLLAVRAAAAQGPLPIKVRFLFEGEEEVGSPSLRAALEANAGLFRADVCLNPDTGMVDPDTPSIRYGLRGLAYFELTVRGPERDLHSGGFGGFVHNPAQALAELIAGIESFLGWNDCSQAFLAGAGNLGRALVGYAALRDAGLEIACAFDTDPIKQAETIGQIQVLPLRRLRTLARRMHIHVGIIAVPAAAAQNVAELMIDGGITAIWNFAPQRLEVPPEVVVEDADMLSGFAVLSHRLQHRLHPVAGR